MAGIYSNCSTREIIIASFVNVTILNLICKGAAASQPLVTDTVVNSLSSQVAVGQTTRRQVLTKHPCLAPTATVHLRHVLSLCKCSGCSWCKVTAVVGRVVVGIAQGQSSTSCSAFCRRRQARPRNKPSAPEWRVVHIYEQICVTCDGWNIKVLVFLTF